MSEYVRCMCPVAKARYLEKLSLLKIDDPYAANSQSMLSRSHATFEVLLDRSTTSVREATQWAGYIRFRRLTFLDTSPQDIPISLQKLFWVIVT